MEHMKQAWAYIVAHKKVSIAVAVVVVVLGGIVLLGGVVLNVVVLVVFSGSSCCPTQPDRVIMRKIPINTIPRPFLLKAFL